MTEFCCEELRNAVDKGVLNTVFNDYGKNVFWSNEPIQLDGETVQECLERSNNKRVNGFESIFLTSCPYCNSEF